MTYCDVSRFIIDRYTYTNHDIEYHDFILPEAIITPENRPSKKKRFHLPTIYFKGIPLVSGRVHPGRST